MIRELGSFDHSLHSDPSIQTTGDLCVLGGVLREVARDAGSLPVAGARATGVHRPRVDLVTPADHDLSTARSRHRDRYARRGTGDGSR